MILILNDITRQLETDSHLDLALQSFTRGVRASLAGIRSAIETIIEFGGGIGNGEPEAKRPNLEGMIKRGMRGTDYEAQYMPAINRQSLEGTAEAIRGAGE